MPWLEDLKFPRGYQMGTHILNSLSLKVPYNLHNLDIYDFHLNLYHLQENLYKGLLMLYNSHQ